MSLHRSANLHRSTTLPHNVTFHTLPRQLQPHRQIRQQRHSATFEHLRRSSILSQLSQHSLSAGSLPADGQPRVKGILWKKGGGRSLFGKRNWKKRYCVIINDKFYYYKDRQTYVDSKKCLKEPYNLRDCDVSVIEQVGNHGGIQKSKSKRKNSLQNTFNFTIQPHDCEMRTLHLRAETAAERDDWVRAIRETEAVNLGAAIAKDTIQNRERRDSGASRRGSGPKTAAEELYLRSQNLCKHAQLREDGKVSILIDLLSVRGAFIRQE